MNPYNNSLFMKNKALKIAAVAVVVLAVLIGLNFFQRGITFAQVSEPILHARTLEYDVVIPEQGTYHDIVAEGRIRRSMRNLSWDMIIDVNNSSVLHLDTVHKTAGFGCDENEAATMYFDMSRDFLRLVRSAVEEALNGTRSAVDMLGENTIDAHSVFGFKLQSGTDGEEAVIWADRETGLPVEIDIHLGMSYPNSLTTRSGPSTPGEPAMVAVVVYPKNYTLKNIRFDVSVDESLMEMPSDYKLIDMKQFRNLLMENGFVELMYLWSEDLLDGFFPENLPPGNIRNQFMSEFPDIMKWTPEEREEHITDEVLRTYDLADGAKQFLTNLNPEEWKDFLRTISFGFGFISGLENSGTEWLYSGNGVRLGEGAREIFRYQMPDSSWHVVYGDLHEEALPADHARQ